MTIFLSYFLKFESYSQYFLKPREEFESCSTKVFEYTLLKLRIMGGGPDRHVPILIDDDEVVSHISLPS